MYETLDAHRDLFGELPEVFSANKGFYGGVKKLKELEKKIETVSICKKGRRNEAEKGREHGEEFRVGQRFRADVEESISVL